MAVKKGNSLVLEKARETLRKAEELVKYLEANNVEEPNFTASSPPHPATEEYIGIADQLTDAANDLILLARGPIEWMRVRLSVHQDLAAWQVALHFKYFDVVPLDKPMSLEGVAKGAGMDIDRTRRLLKMLATQGCFKETENDVYEHTALSAFIRREKEMATCIEFHLDEMFEAAAASAPSIKKHPFESKAETSAFNYRFGVSPYQFYMGNPERAAHFALAMAGFAKITKNPESLRDLFPWAELKNKTVVDIGGGSGHISMLVAKKYPDLKFIVQDNNPLMLAEGPKRPGYDAIKDQISFMEYNFYEPQPVKDAGVYLLRQVAHNYPDDVCVKIFKVVADTLTAAGPEARFLINDMILPELNEVPKIQENNWRQVDLLMMNSYGAKQRTVKEFEGLLKEADQRFKISNVYGKGIHGIVEVCLEA